MLEVFKFFLKIILYLFQAFFKSFFCINWIYPKRNIKYVNVGEMHIMGAILY